MAEEKAFLVPVVIDDTTERNASVPEKFREVQWTHLPAGEAPSTFVERISGLLSHDESRAPGRVAPTQGAWQSTFPASRDTTRKSGTYWRFRAVVVLIVVAVVVAGGYFAIGRFVLSKRPTEAKLASALSIQSAATAPNAIPEKSIAVLPFVDMSENHDQGYFSDGLSEELIDLLTKVPELRVPARTSSFYFKGKSEKIATIAQELGVAHVLEGSVRKAGKTVRVTAQLIRADNGYHLWSETYDRDIKDIF